MIEDSEYSATPREAANYLIDRVEEFANTALASPNLADSEKSQLKTSLALLRRSFNRLNSQFSKYVGTDKSEEAGYYMEMMYLIRSTFFIGSCATISDASQLYAKRKQAELARSSRGTTLRKSQLMAAIAEIISKNTKIGAVAVSDKFAMKIRPMVLEQLGITEDQEYSEWPKVRTIKECLGKIKKGKV